VLPLQLTFIYGLWVALLTLGAGATLSLMPRFTADSLPSCMDDGATALAVVPSMLRTLLSSDALFSKGPRLLLTGGETLGAHLRHAIRDLWPETNLVDLYGLTETGSCDFSLSSASAITSAGAIGFPTEGIKFRIAESEQGLSDIGELQICTPFGMLGYLDDPALTSAAFADEFFRTGDLARVRPDGFVELAGRSKEIVSRGGNKIAPQEVDHILCSHPAVAGALSAGVPHPRLGEAIYTVVVLKADTDLTVTELRHWLSERLERFKLPDTLSIEAFLPVGSTGKASRTLLREIAIARSETSHTLSSDPMSAE
jgi:long-chain acyl-CoA synthetase